MCLSDAFPLALLDNDRVHAVALAQPTLPLLDGTEVDTFDLGLSLEEWDNTLIRIGSEKPLYEYGVRFQNDEIADREKHNRMNEIFNHIQPGSFYDREICFKEYEAAGLEENAHPT